MKKTKLTMAEQKILMKTIPAIHLNNMKKHCQMMSGNGRIGDIWSSIKEKFSAVVPFIKNMSNKVLNDVLLPKIGEKFLPIASNLLKKALGFGGNGLKIAGQRSYGGAGLSIAGDGVKKSLGMKRKQPKLYLG
jgi:hypothetical protein